VFSVRKKSKWAKEDQKMFEKKVRDVWKRSKWTMDKKIKLSEDVSLKNNGGGRVTANCSMMPIF
jgi:hypothetical protein